MLLTCHKMVTLEVYTKCIRVKYKAFLLSKATFICLISSFITTVLPFLLSYETGDFWQKHDVLLEQPDVRFAGNFLLVATTNYDEKPLRCSTFSDDEEYVNIFDHCSVVKIRESDENYDQKSDSLHFTISAKLPPKIHITSFHLVLPLNYSLSSPCAFHIQSAIIHQQSIHSKVSEVTVYGDLDFYQSEPVTCARHTVINTYPAIIQEEPGSKILENIIENYAKSKMKTTMSNVLKTFNHKNEDTFTISLEIRYPDHKIYFKPRLWQILKFAWIQYVAIYIIISWVIGQINNYIFKNNLVLLYEDRTDINKK